MIRTTLLLTASLLTIGAAMAFAAPQVQKPAPPTKEELAKYANAKATITTKFGKIVVKFFPDLAPMHVKNFVTLRLESRRRIRSPCVASMSAFSFWEGIPPFLAGAGREAGPTVSG